MYRHALLALACLALVAPALAAAPLWTHNATVPVRDCAVSADGRMVVVSSDLVHLFDRKGGLAATTWRSNDVAVNGAGTLVVSGTDVAARGVARNGTELWSAPNGTAVVAVSGDGATIAALTPGGFLTTFSAAGARIAGADTASTGEIVDLAVSKNGSVIVSIDKGGVRAFTRKTAKRWSVELANPSALAMNASGDLVAVGDGGSVKFYNLTGEQVARVPTGGRVRSLAMTPSANLTVAGVEDGTVAALGPDGGLLWDLSVGGRVNGVAVSVSGAVIAVASTDRTLRLYDRAGTPLWEAPLAGEPRSLALSADGTTVAVGCDEGTAYAFDTAVKPSAAPTTPKKANATAAGATPSPASNGTSTPGATATAAVSATATGAAITTSTTPLQLVVVDGTPKSGAAAFLPAAALALGIWAGRRRRR